jgi:hypothetical protein
MTPMRRIREQADFSLSYLDFFCCALGGVIALMFLLVPMHPGGATGLMVEEEEPISGRVHLGLTLPVVGPPAETRNRISPAAPAPPDGFVPYDFRTLLTAQRVRSRLIMRRYGYQRDDEFAFGPATSGRVEPQDAPFGGRVGVTWQVDSENDRTLPLFRGFDASSLAIELGLELPLDAQHWPLEVEWNLSIELPEQLIDERVLPLWKALIAQWDVLFDPDVAAEARVGWIPQATIKSGNAETLRKSLGLLWFVDGAGLGQRPIGFYDRNGHRLRCDIPWMKADPNAATQQLVADPGNPIQAATGLPLEAARVVRGNSSYLGLTQYAAPGSAPKTIPLTAVDRTLHLQVKAQVALAETTVPGTEDGEEGDPISAPVVKLLTIRPIDPAAAVASGEFPKF